MKQILFVVTLICGYLFSQGAVLGIFESTNFPAGITGSGDGVYRLEIIDNELYAATEKGIYRYSEADNSWNSWGLKDINVLDFKVCGDEIVAIIVPPDQKGHEAVAVAELVRLKRNQNDWENIMDEEMGYLFYDQFLSYIMRIAQHPGDPCVLMVVAYPGIWISEDFGTSWDFKFDYLYAYNGCTGALPPNLLT